MPARETSLDAMIDREISSLLVIYKTLHAAPELSHHEEKTSALVAKELRSLGYAVTDSVGKYARPEIVGYGVVAVLKNGPGPDPYSFGRIWMRCRLKKKPGFHTPAK